MSWVECPTCGTSASGTRLRFCPGCGREFTEHHQPGAVASPPLEGVVAGDLKKTGAFSGCMVVLGIVGLLFLALSAGPLPIVRHLSAAVLASGILVWVLSRNTPPGTHLRVAGRVARKTFFVAGILTSVFLVFGMAGFIILLVVCSQGGGRF